MIKMKLIVALTAGNLISGCGEGEKGLTGKPNFILIVADDLGYGDLSCYGSQRIETPGLDALAAKGARLTQFYSASAVCTPTRASLLTGSYPLRFNIRQYFPRNGFLPEDPLTLAELLKENGYYTAHVGKWHLGGLSGEHRMGRKSGESTDPGPNQHGFEFYLTTMEGDTAVPDLLGMRRSERDGGKYLISNDERMPEREGFLTDIFTDEAIRIIGDMHDSGNPFFLNLWYKVPHTPYEPAPEPHYSKYASKNYPEAPDQNFHRGHNAPGDEVLYNSMVSVMDYNISRIIEKLKETGLFDNTFIVFTSDNGPSYRGSPAPWTGGKADLHEGGIRVPMIACWPDRIPADRIYSGFAHSNDILNTFAEAAGFGAQQNDGISILSMLEGSVNEIPRGMVFWQMDQAIDPWGNIWYPQPGSKPDPYANCVVRDGEWKLLTDSIIPKALYKLDIDPLEHNNLLDAYPEQKSKMLDSLKIFLSAPRLTCGRNPNDPKSL